MKKKKKNKTKFNILNIILSKKILISKLKMELSESPKKLKKYFL